MTIHKAKGLEFDTVILPGLGAVPRSETMQRLLLWLEHRGELLLAPISESGGDKDPIYRYLASIERRKSDQETARLLYVAATRARRSLHLLGSATAKERWHDWAARIAIVLEAAVAGGGGAIRESRAARAGRADAPRRKPSAALPATWRVPPAPAAGAVEARPGSSE